jgi:8-oxo-dGTP pyrophosphatase MutT (NUDIX family)
LNSSGEEKKEEMPQTLITRGEWAGGIPWEFFATTEETPPAQELCTTAFCVVTFQGKLVIVEHAKRGFELPGGHINLDEEIVKTVEREVLEEVGASIRSPQYFGYKRVSPPLPIPHRDDPGKFYPFPHSYVPYFYAEAIEVFETQLASDVKSVRVVPFAEAKALFAPGHNHQHIVQHLISTGAVEVE